MRSVKLSNFIILLLIFIPVYFVSIIEYNYRYVFIILALLLLITIKFSSKKIVLKHNKYNFLWLVAYAVVLLSMLLHSVDKFYLLFFTTCFLLIILFSYDGLEWCELTSKLIKWLSVFFASMTIIQVIFRNLYINIIAPILNSNSTFNPVVQMNQGLYSGFTNQTAINAMYLSAGVGVLYVNFLFNKRKISTVIILVIEIACIILSAKRGHLIYSSVALLIVTYLNSKKSKRFTNAIKITFSILFILVIIYYTVPAASFFFDRILNPSGDITNGRISRYIPALEYFKSHPVFGIGWERFRFTFYKYTDVHNIYLQLLCETGVIGTTAFILLFVYSIVDTIKTFNKTAVLGLENERKYLSLSIYFQLFFLFYGMSGNGLYDYYIFFFYVFAVLIYTRCKYKILNLERQI